MLRIYALAGLASVHLAASSVASPPAALQLSNDCTTAQDVGLGMTPFSALSGWSQDPVPAACQSSISPMIGDRWYRYTACVDETLTIVCSTDDPTNGNCSFFGAQFYVALYDSADCNTASVTDCDLRFCFDVSTVPLTLVASAGESYLIRVGCEAFSFASPPWGTGTLTISSDREVGTDLCAGEPNSVGSGASFWATGSDVALDNTLCFSVVGLPTQSMGYFLNSRETITVVSPGGNQGTLCIGSFDMGRHAGDVLDSGDSGSVSFAPDLTAIPGPTGVRAAIAGETWYWQYWYRDANPSATSNFSSARCVLFQ